ncbi:MAG: GNAT family N-acetyltransferase [Bacteroidales bacterium]|nr:GNAT family N-acetyltransferase [Bacteroidales bacterium]
MNIDIVPVESKRQMKQFINFTLDLYRNCPYYVPELAFDVMATLDPRKNPAYEFCQAQPYLAFKDGKVAGRVVALMNEHVNEKWEQKIVRFSWIDFIEDYDVCKALLDTVVAWGKERGMSTLQGPMGFTDFDREGALTYGYDRIATMATTYNYPYYIDFYERYGLVKGAEWKEMLVTLTVDLPEKFARLTDIVKERYGLRVHFAKNARELKKYHAKPIFDLLNTCYADLYGFAKLSDKQIDKYVNDYITFADMDLLPLVFNEQNEMVGCALMIPSLVKALVKTRGKLFPFGWWHLVKSLYLKHDDTIEFLLIAIRPDYQAKGVNSLIVSALEKVFKEKGYKYAETNCELEDNHKMLNFWNNLPHEVHKKRRAFIKDI